MSHHDADHDGRRDEEAGGDESEFETPDLEDVMEKNQSPEEL